MRHVVISGPLYAGKSTLAAVLEENGYLVVSARGVLRDLAGESLATRRELQEFGSDLEARTRGAWLAEATAAAAVPGTPIVVDAVRTVDQLHAVHAVLPEALHVHLEVTPAGQAKRFGEHAD